MIEFLICTISERICHIADNLPPTEPDVRYLVSWQHAGSDALAPPTSLSQRTDVSIIANPGIGLSANRNAALLAARGDILVIADDDCRFSAENIENIRTAFSSNPTADVILFRLTDYGGNLLRTYPTESYAYPYLPRGAYFCSCEIALRRHAGIPLFDERFGLGAPYLKGAEELEWILRMYRKLHSKIIFVPLNIAATASATSGTRLLTDPGMQRANGALHRLMHGLPASLLRFTKYSLTAPLPIHKRVTYFLHLVQGALYVGKTKA